MQSPKRSFIVSLMPAVKSKNGDAIGERLREYRLSRHWTLKRIARKVRLDVSTISRIERGQKVTPRTRRILTDSLPGLEG